MTATAPREATLIDDFRDRGNRMLFGDSSCRIPQIDSYRAPVSNAVQINDSDAEIASDRIERMPEECRAWVLVRYENDVTGSNVVDAMGAGGDSTLAVRFNQESAHARLEGARIHPVVTYQRSSDDAPRR